MTRSLLLALLALLVVAPAAGASSLVDVPIQGPQSLVVLERLGIDITHDVSTERARVVLHDEADRRALTDTGFVYETVVPDIEATLQRSFARRRGNPTQRSALPSGRDVYRVFSEYVDELDALAQDHAGLVRKVTIGKSIEDRDLVGVEIAKDVNRTDDGRPIAAFFGLHHAREWPSGEVNMEFATELAAKYGTDPRITALLEKVRIFVFPVINPDGFVVSRGTVPAAGGGPDPLHRRNCRPNTEEEAAVPCPARGNEDGVDLNRNYGAAWGGYGASADHTQDDYRGTGPFSEPESQAVHEFSRVHQIMHVQSTHNIVGWVLRQPGFTDYGEVSPDEGIMKALGDQMGVATSYESLLGTALYPVHGATEDWNYIEQGAMGYTIELGPSDTEEGGGDAPLFFGPYQTHVIDQYLGGGTGTGGPAGKGIHEAFLLAGEQAANPLDHGVLDGAAQPGYTLRVHKDFTTDTAKLCPETGSCDENTPRLPEVKVPDFLDTTLTVPDSGRFEWHVGPSTRPWVGKDGAVEKWVFTCEAPDGTVLARQEIEVRRGQKLTFANACDASAPVTSSQSEAPPPLPGSPGVPGSEGTDTPPTLPPRSLRVFVGPQRMTRGLLRRRGYLRAAVKARGGSLTNLRLRLNNRRALVASRSFARLSGPRVVRMKLSRVPPRGVYSLSLSGVADNGATVFADVRLRIV